MVHAQLGDQFLFLVARLKCHVPNSVMWERCLLPKRFLSCYARFQLGLSCCVAGFGESSGEWLA